MDLAAGFGLLSFYHAAAAMVHSLVITDADVEMITDVAVGFGLFLFCHAAVVMDQDLEIMDVAAANLA